MDHRERERGPGHRLLRVWLAVGVVLSTAWSATGRESPASGNRITPEVQRELLTLPFYTVFDNLTFRIEGDTVTLLGQVTRAALKSDAENAVRRIEGVARVNNQIEVLPLSASDGRMRLAEYLAIYGDAGLSQYATRSAPPIHIVVKSGNVTLEGTVDGKYDKNLAFSQASSVPGVASVTDHLRVSP
ncbi:MAG TPA: BON domain-containing protein [Bryobacteraceae bacterium]|nr:BON domain-containing protein [Bryobacteraceae bacterium]